MEYVLETNALCKRYHDFTALNGLDMHIPKGSIYGFVGRNGAGKTTLIRLICGLQEPTGGSFTLYGAKNTDARIGRSRRRMGAVVETPSICMDMTAEENIRQQYLVLGLPSMDGAQELLRLVGLDGTGKKKAKNFSLGMRQRLGIAVALAGSPDFLVLDELVKTADDVRALGIDTGCYISWEPRTVLTESGFLKSRHLDDKASSGVLLALAKAIKAGDVLPSRRVYIMFTVYEEVGHAGAESVPAGVTEAMSVDMG